MTENHVYPERNLKIGYTHAGVFHADEVFSTAALRILSPDMKVNRVLNIPENINDDTPDVIIYDIGGGMFDHHQKGGNGCRENGMPFSSFGLIWQRFGLDLCQCNEEAADEVDRVLVEGIDAVDNGCMEIISTHKVMSVSGIISSFNPRWDEEGADPQVCFDTAVKFASTVLANTIASALSKARAKKLVTKAVENCRGSKVLELPRYAPWQDHLFSINGTDDFIYVIFPSNRGGYNVQAVPDAPDSFGMRKPLPESWRGLKYLELAEISGIDSASFVHPVGFIGGCSTLEGARLMASKAVEA